MGQTPSNRRREGRNAFVAGENPEILCRYREEHKREDWLDGWDEALATHKEEEAEAEKECSEFGMLANTCPWSNDDVECAATGWGCCQEHCALWHFKQS